MACRQIMAMRYVWIPGFISKVVGSPVSMWRVASTGKRTRQAIPAIGKLRKSSPPNACLRLLAMQRSLFAGLCGSGRSTRSRAYRVCGCGNRFQLILTTEDFGGGTPALTSVSSTTVTRASTTVTGKEATDVVEATDDMFARIPGCPTARHAFALAGSLSAGGACHRNGPGTRFAVKPDAPMRPAASRMY